MKKQLILPILTAFMVISCDKKEPEQKATSSKKENTDVVITPDSLKTSTSCYSGAIGQDSTFISFDDNLGTVVGKLYFKNHEKDSSFGDIVGSSVGDTLKVDYEFYSEGQLSTREIWFLKKDGKLLEAVGPLHSSGEKYSDYKKIKFENALNTADCAIVDKAIRTAEAKFNVKKNCY